MNNDLLDRLRSLALYGVFHPLQTDRAIRDAIGEIEHLNVIRTAAERLLADVRRRYPGEALRCPLMIALDDATKPSITEA